MKQEDFIRQMTRREKTEATVMKDGRCFVTERLHNRGFLIKDNPRGDEDYAVEDPERLKAGRLLSGGMAAGSGTGGIVCTGCGVRDWKSDGKGVPETRYQCAAAPGRQYQEKSVVREKF